MQSINFDIWEVRNFVALVQFTWNLMAGDVLAVHYLYDISEEIIVKITDKQGTLRNDV
ncbi:MAG: hypothetical protein M3530_12215 [Thermoproteota archaeon]|nr:hypothetical protein [Thermoproteota archaeon]